MRTNVTIATMAALAAFATIPAFATAHTSALAGYTEAEVRKVDRAAGKVTLKHGPIANLEMPPMTMVFVVSEPKLIAGVKEGDKVRFKAEKVKDTFKVTELVPLK